MANYDERIVLGAMADVASAKKTGEEIGRAAGDAATSAFLASFNSVYNKIPTSKRGAGKGGYYIDSGDRRQISHFVKAATEEPAGSSAKTAAMKNVLNILSEFRRKAPISAATQLILDTAVAQGKEAINVNTRLGRQETNKQMKMAQKLETLEMNREIKRVGSFSALVEALDAKQSEIELNNQYGARTDKVSGLRGQRKILKALLNDRYKGLRDDEQTEKWGKQLDENTKEMRKLALTQVAASTAITGATAAIGMASTILPSIWGQHVTRNVFASKTAFNERVLAAGKMGGGVIGGALGGGIGAFFGGPAGALIGTNIGSTVGGAIGGLFGEKNKTTWEAHQRTISDMQTRIRMNNIYRGAYSASFGNAIQEMGIASASDMENMVGNSQTLAARMMFGQVGENEMLMYSLMPNYFAAAMNGASDAELAQAYAQDLNALPPMFRLWAGSAVGGGSAGMVGFAQDPFFASVMKNAGFAHAIDNAMVGYSGGWQEGSVERGVMNMMYAIAGAMQDTDQVKAERGVFNNKHIRPAFLTNGKYNANKKDYDWGVTVANALEYNNAALGNGKYGSVMPWTWDTYKNISSYEDMFTASGANFASIQKMLAGGKNGYEYGVPQNLIEQWLGREMVIQIYMNDNKQEEIRVRGEQAAKNGKMSVYAQPV